MNLEYLDTFAGLLRERQELRSQTNFTRQIIISGGNIMQNQRSEESGIFSRDWYQGAFGASSHPGFDRANIEATIKVAQENAKYLASFTSDFKNLPPSKVARLLPHTTFIDPSQSQLIDFARQMDNYIEKTYPNLTNRTIQVAVESTNTQLLTLNAISFERVLPRAHIYITLMAKDNEGSPVSLRIRLGGGGNFSDYFEKVSDFEETIDDAYNMLMDKTEAVYSKAGTADVVMSADIAGILAHEAVGHTTESDLVRSGSIASRCMNQRVAHEKVSLVDYAHTAFGKEAPLPIYVDDEGTLGEDVIIIKDGILQDYMTNIQDAAYIGTTPKGNGRAFSYSDEPLVRMRNTCILPGKDSLDEMISSIDEGYYLLYNSNGQADSTSEFMFGITMGYEIKNGKLGKAIKDTTISGVAFELLKTIDMVGPEVSWAAGGYCGKKTRLGNAMGGPAVKCRLQIGGR